MSTLTDIEKAEIARLLEQDELDKPPDHDRLHLFDDKREVELVWNGKTSEVTNVVLPFQTIEHVDEPRIERSTTDDELAGGQFDSHGRQMKGWTNKLIWGDNKLILSSLKNGPLRDEIEKQGGLKLIYIDPPFDVGADFSMDIEVGDGGDTFHKRPNILEEIAYRDTWGKGADLFIATTLGVSYPGNGDAMTQEPTISCPNCKTEIKLTESLAAPLIEATRQQYETKLSVQSADFAKREQAVRSREEQLAREKESLDEAVAERVKQERAMLAADAAKREKALNEREEQLTKEKESADALVTEKIKAERSKISADAAKKARLALGNDLELKEKELVELTEVLKQRDEKLAEAQKAQADLIRKQRELDDAKREMDLTVEKRISESLATTREQAKREAEESLSLKLIEKETTIASMQQKIEELKKKAEQGSQQLQGEALELQLEAILCGRFPHDLIEPVAKGEHGGDLLHRVVSPTGTRCGTILWETKRTRNWSDGWLVKLREDQRQARAEIAVIASAVLPKGCDSFDQIDGVWVVHPRCVLPVALSLRHLLTEVSTARTAGEGQQTKTEMMYGYLTGPKFRLRVQAIVEAFSTMGDDLLKEKKATMRQWAKRDEQIHRVMEATVGMYGEMQGIAGKTLGEIEGLEASEKVGDALQIVALTAGNAS